MIFFVLLELKDVPGVILYREFSNAENVIHATSIGGTTGASYYNPTRDLVDSYLCSDGKTVGIVRYIRETKICMTSLVAGITDSGCK